MYVVSEADAAATRTAYETGGELSTAWTPLPDRPKPPRRVRKAPSE
jgi:hypothetical protein